MTAPRWFHQSRLARSFARQTETLFRARRLSIRTHDLPAGPTTNRRNPRLRTRRLNHPPAAATTRSKVRLPACRGSIRTEDLPAGLTMNRRQPRLRTRRCNNTHDPTAPETNRRSPRLPARRICGMLVSPAGCMTGALIEQRCAEAFALLILHI